MKKIIMDILEDMSNSHDGQLNLTSDASRETTAKIISSTLKSKGSYIVFTDSEIDEQKMQDSWVCSICGKNTYDVDYDYIGTGTNHLGCELEIEMSVDELKLPSDMKLKNPGDKEDKRVTTNVRRKGDRRENRGGDVAKALGHMDEDGEFITEDIKTGHDQGGSYEYPYNSFVRSKEDIQKQAYVEMTSDGLPEGGDAQAVLESHKLAEEIVEAQEGTWIYESPDGGKTVFRRPFSDYDPKNKEEIDFKTKEPTGRKFTDYPFVKDVQIDGC